jgi:sulfur-oxidizing protein SoxY
MRKNEMHRRQFIKALSSTLAAVWLAPKMALAAIWNKPVFETTQMTQALKDLGADLAIKSDKIQIKAPDRAENGAIVQVEIDSSLANTESIAILVEKNPTPLIATYNLVEGVAGYVVTRIKMADTSDITVIVKAGGVFYKNTKNVVVLESGCG